MVDIRNFTTKEEEGVPSIHDERIINEESLRISLEQSKAGIGVPFDLDDYIGCNDNIFKDTPIFKAIPFDAGGCSLQELYGAPEHNALPTLAEQLGEGFEVRTHVYHNGEPVTLAPPTIEFHYVEGKSITMAELIEMDKVIKAAETIAEFQSRKPV